MKALSFRVTLRWRGAVPFAGADVAQLRAKLDDALQELIPQDLLARSRSVDVEVEPLREAG